MPKMCPLLLIAKKGSTECPGKECAWYVTHEQPDSEGCAIKELSDSLKTIGLQIPLPK